MIKAPQKGAFFCWGRCCRVVPSPRRVITFPLWSFQRPPSSSCHNPHRVILSKAKDLKSASWYIQILHFVQNDNKRAIKEQ